VHSLRSAATRLLLPALVAPLAVLAFAPAPARGQTPTFITEGISPGQVYSFEPITGAGLHQDDYHNAWFVDESAETHSTIAGAFADTYIERHLVQPGVSDYSPDGYHAQVATFHCMARGSAFHAIVDELEDASFEARQFWAFQVTDPTDPTSTARVHAVISGRMFFRGQMTVWGFGQASAEADLIVRPRSPDDFEAGPPVLTGVIASYSINHSNDFSVGGGVGLELGAPFDGGGVAVSASRAFSNERLRFEDDDVEFSYPLTLKVGGYYELEVSFSGSSRNRGIPGNISAVLFANGKDIDAHDSANDPDSELFLSENDPSHLLGTIDFFELTLPDIGFGTAFAGKEKWDFPKLGSLFDGQLINMSNSFKIEPFGKIQSVSDAFSKLGLSPNFGEKLAGSGEVAAPIGPGNAPPDYRGGVWLGDLVITVEDS